MFVIFVCLFLGLGIWVSQEVGEGYPGMWALGSGCREGRGGGRKGLAGQGVTKGYAGNSPKCLESY